MATFVTLNATFKPEALEGAVGWINSADGLPTTRKQKGCIQIDAYADSEKSNAILMVELWESKEDHQAYLKWRTERGDMDKLGSMLEGPPVIAYYERVG